MADTTTKERDYFTDPTVLVDPVGYHEEMRPKGPVCPIKNYDALLVNGFEEYVEASLNSDDFSAVNALSSAGVPLPFEPVGSDISQQIEENRTKFVGHKLVISHDGKRHTNSRSMTNRLFTGSRLKTKEKFMRSYAEELVVDVVAKGKCEWMSEVATRYISLLLADLMDVPSEDLALFEEIIATNPMIGSQKGRQEDSAATSTNDAVYFFVADYMCKYLEKRRKNPGDDVISELATATYRDGRKPDMNEQVTLTTLMFIAGQDTSASLMTNVIRYICDVPGLQQQIRDDRSLIPAVIEEVLRLEGSTKATQRVAIHDTKIGDHEVPAGTQVMLGITGANRDPNYWGEDADEFRLKRPNVRKHLSFGRGVHMCPGAGMVRAQTRTMLEVLLDKTSDIRISEKHHGKADARNYPFEPSYIIHSLTDLHIELTPA